MTPFVELQRWLSLAGESRVAVPFAQALAGLLPAKGMDEEGLSAVAHENSGRSRASTSASGSGRPRAGSSPPSRTTAGARKLLAPVFDTIASDGVTPEGDSHCRGHRHRGRGASVTQSCGSLQIAKATASYRVDKSLQGGRLVNLETGKGKAYRLKRDAPLPEDQSALPTVERLFGQEDSTTVGVRTPCEHSRHPFPIW